LVLLDVTQHRMVVSYRRVWTDSLLKVGPVSCPEALDTINKSTSQKREDLIYIAVET